MGVMFAFLVGWVVGAKSGPTEFAELAAAARTVKESEEFAALVAVARQHVALSLEGLSRLLSGETGLPEPADLLSQVDRLVARRS